MEVQLQNILTFKKIKYKINKNVYGKQYVNTSLFLTVYVGRLYGKKRQLKLFRKIGGSIIQEKKD